MRIAILPANKLVQDANGTWTEFSTADLDEIANSYDSKNPAPVVVGHPKDNTPAFGWWDGVKRIGNHLFAEVKDSKLNPTFQKALQEKLFRNWSASIYQRDSTANPTPGKLNLRHIGFLGGARPAFGELFAHADNQLNFVDRGGILNFTFNFMDEELQALKDLESITLTDIARVLGIEESALQEAIDQNKPEPEMPPEFAEKEARLRQREAAIKAKESALLAQECQSFCEGLVAEGKPLPVSHEEIISFMTSLPNTTELSFAEGKKQKSLEWFKGLLQKLPKQVEFKEIAGSGGELDFADNPRAIADKSRAYRQEMAANGKTISVAESVSHVMNQAKK